MSSVSKLLTSLESIQSVLEITRMCIFTKEVFPFFRSERASYCEWRILLPPIIICHVPSRSKGCLWSVMLSKKHKMLERQYIEISTGQSASPSLERLPSSSPTTQPSQWWGTSMKYLQLDWVTTTLCLHRVIKLLEVIVNNIDIYCIFITAPFKFLYHINTVNDIW